MFFYQSKPAHLNLIIAVFLFLTAGINVSAVAQINNLIPVTDATLKDPAPADWLRWRRDSSATGYSPLSQINAQNINKLQFAWSWAMQSGDAEQEPIVYDGVMYLPQVDGVIHALDAKSGELFWEYKRVMPLGTRRGTTRNITLYQDKVYMTSTDAFLIALNAKTGEIVWEKEAGDSGAALTYSSGPIAGNGMIFAGQTCWLGVTQTCSLGAFDAETGDRIWQRSSIAGPGDPAEHNATWGGLPYEKRMKASFWQTGSYDPELDLVYWTTASAYPYPEIHKGSGDGSLLYSNSILALDAKTGQIRWFYQMLPRDNFDMDHQGNPILADVVIAGSLRKVVYATGKPGILWAFDRISGEHLWNEQLVEYQNLYDNIDAETGEVTINTNLIPKKIGDSSLVCPGMRGGRLFQSNAYSPITNLIYTSVSNECNTFTVVPLELASAGVQYGELQHMQGANEKVGRVSAVSASTGNIVWEYDQRAALGSILTTAGGLVFVGDLHRYFIALDASSGKKLWDIPLSSPVNGYPISYSVDGKQYIAVSVGGGSAGNRHLAQLYPELKSINGSPVLMVFSLGHEQ
jgi:PQQ-dependent dehydrogenase (methanol/ethanol family)